MSDLPTYILERTFDAPGALVWRAWTEPELFAHWYGPNIETVIHEMVVKPGGRCLVEMRMGGGSSYQSMEYLEVSAPVRLVWINATTDKHWQPTPNPGMPEWPRRLLTTVTFTEKGGDTAMRLTWAPHEASESEIAFFQAAIGGMNKGWAAGMSILAELLTQLKKDHGAGPA